MDYEKSLEYIDDVETRPRIKGTRIYVDMIVFYWSHGWFDDDNLKAYPHLEQIQLDAIKVFLRENRRASEGVYRNLLEDAIFMRGVEVGRKAETSLQHARKLMGARKAMHRAEDK